MVTNRSGTVVYRNSNGEQQHRSVRRSEHADGRDNHGWEGEHRMNARRLQGLTLVEVLIALTILGVGLVAAAQLQAASLRFTSQAELMKTSTQLAAGEVEWRRQTELTT